MAQLVIVVPSVVLALLMGSKSSVYHEMGTGDKGSVFAGKESHCFCNVIRHSKTSQRVLRHQLAALTVIIASARHIPDKSRGDRTCRAHRIYPDSKFGQFQRKALHKLQNAAFRGVVGKAFHTANDSQFACGTDNRAMAAFF